MKYHAKPTVCAQGHKHASKREAARCGELHLLERGEVILGLQVEPKYTFVVNGAPVKMRNGHLASYRPDFSYVEKGVKVCEDVKSDATMTEAFALRAALFRHLYPNIELRVVK